MKLISARIGPYKSINEPQTVVFDDRVTVMVGQNEAGKSAILEALNKTRPVAKDAKFEVIYDYPRKDLTRYERDHPKADTMVVILTFRLSDGERQLVADKLGEVLPEQFQFSLGYRYNNTNYVDFQIDLTSAYRNEISRSGLSAKAKTALKVGKSHEDAIKIIEQSEPTDETKALLSSLQTRIKSIGGTGWNLAQWEAYQAIYPFIPSFLYFSDYNVLPGKTNLLDLAERTRTKQLRPRDRSALALLNMAGVNLGDLLREKSHEETIARLEGFSIEVSDRVFQFWKQNEQLEVRFDIAEDPKEESPFDNGPNLYIRIFNKRHRVSVPFDQRSRGFIWFFSFLVWFDDAQAQAESKTPIFLLLDEPGLSLHGLAQADFLRYINHLGEVHQVVYTTHSPFLVESNELDRVRVVEDEQSSGTTISDRLDSRDPRSIFPLQAALGYTIAQNLFIADRNLLIEGPADLLFLQAASSALETEGGVPLNSNIVLVPVGGLDKVATFIALLAGNQLKFAVCVDKSNVPDQRLEDMIMQKLISDRALLDYGMFRTLEGPTTDPTDVEDLFVVSHYLAMFNAAYAADLKGVALTETDLPPGSRVVQRLNAALVSKSITLRKSGGFNHFLVASRAVSSGLIFEPDELKRFEALFKRVNSLLA